MNEYGWSLWLVLLVIFAVAEAATVSMVSLWFVGGALAAMIAQIAGASIGVQIVLFLAVSGALLACLRPFVKKFVNPKRTATNTDAVIGKQAVVTQVVDNLHGTGALKLEGKEWSARSVSGEPLQPGEVVTVVRIEGVKLYVERACAAVEN